MATDEPDSDAVSEGLRQLRRTRGGSVYAPPSSPEGAGGRRPRPTKSSSAPAGTQLGAGQQKFVEESPEAQKVKGTVLASPAPEPAVTEEQYSPQPEYGIILLHRYDADVMPTFGLYSL